MSSGCLFVLPNWHTQDADELSAICLSRAVSGDALSEEDVVEVVVLYLEIVKRGVI